MVGYDEIKISGINQVIILTEEDNWKIEAPMGRKIMPAAMKIVIMLQGVMSGCQESMRC